MMIKRLILCGLALILLQFPVLNAQTREVLASDDQWPMRPVQVRHTWQLELRATGADTLPFSASQPFFDDFAYAGQAPDSNKWFLGTEKRYPLISHGLAIDPPSRGVLSFDGADSEGGKYERNSLVSGEADWLISQCIDLSEARVTDDIRLSFYLQPQGLGNRPEVLDSFFVYFRNVDGELERQFGVAGSSVSEFQQIILPVAEGRYFHAGFQMAFGNLGSLNGYVDQWHLDYVFLGANRGTVGSSQAYRDLSPLAVTSSPMAPYTAIPLEHYRLMGNPFTSFNISVSNLHSQVLNASTEAVLSDPVAGTPFSGNSSLQLFGTFPARAVGPLPFNSLFDKQNFSQPAAFEMDLGFPDGVDDQDGNNRFRVRYPIDSVLAYDDGEAEAIYGLNASRGFGAEFILPRPDTLTAVWMNFVPLLNFNPNSEQAVCMEDRAFRLLIWDDPHPDSVLARQLEGAIIRYGDSLNHFERYELSRPVIVPDTFWVGLQQLDAFPVGIGFDLSYPQNERMYWDSAGVWTRTNLGGTFMIRPEFGKADPSNIVTSNAPLAIDSKTVLRSFPNPLTHSQLQVELAPDTSPIKRYQLRVYDAFGKLVWEHTTQPRSQPNLSLSLPAFLSNGVYTLQHSLHFASLQNAIFAEKLILMR